MTKKGRTQDHSIDVRATAEDVWSAITEAEGLKRWFANDVDVQPGLGGTQTIKWDGYEMTNQHLVWQPGERLRLGSPDHETADGWGALIVDYTLESDGSGNTRLRLVQSGLPEGADWDDAFEGTDLGWTLFLATLQHYLERHLGKPRRVLSFMTSIARPAAEVHALLTGPTMLAADGAIDNVPANASYRARTSAGDHLEGRILAVRPGRLIAATVSGMDDGLLAFALRPTKKGTYLELFLSTWGWDGHDAVAKRWKQWLGEKLEC